MHIRSVGNWTTNLHNYFLDITKDPQTLQKFSSNTRCERRRSTLGFTLLVLFFLHLWTCIYKKTIIFLFVHVSIVVKSEYMLPTKPGGRKQSRTVEQNLNSANSLKNVWLSVSLVIFLFHFIWISFKCKFLSYSKSI